MGGLEEVAEGRNCTFIVAERCCSNTGSAVSRERKTAEGLIPPEYAKR